MKTEEEIRKAHDVLKASITHGTTNNRLIESIRPIAMSICLDVLCWVLEHDHDTALERNLLEIEAAMFGAGLMVKNGEVKKIID